MPAMLHRAATSQYYVYVNCQKQQHLEASAIACGHTTETSTDVLQYILHLQQRGMKTCSVERRPPAEREISRQSDRSTVAAG